MEEAMDTTVQIREFVLETLYVNDHDGLRDDESLLERGLLDSTGVLEVIAFLEDHFGIIVEDDEIHPENLDSVDRIVRFVERKRLATS